MAKKKPAAGVTKAYVKATVNAAIKKYAQADARQDAKTLSKSKK